MKQKPADSISIIEHLRSVRLPFARDHKLDIYGISGSVARGEQVVGSDVDVAARIIERIGFFEIVDAQKTLEGVLNCSVDIVFPDALPEMRRIQFERDLVQL
jgi:uncharacterized protein